MPAPKLLNNVKFLQKCIIVDDKGLILALRRDPKDVRRPNCWDLPGGNYEEGETIDDCIKREVKEETSLTIHTVRPLYVSGNMGTTYHDINVIALTQMCSDWTGEVVLSSEHVEFRWVKPGEFMELETGDDGGFIKDSLRAYTDIVK
jgi:8-oxo-dGTP diphosphatase